MKHLTVSLLRVSAILLLLPVFAAAQTGLGPKDGVKEMPADLERIKPGIAAPDFTLENVDGKPVTLSEYRGKQSIVLVFYRGYW